MRLPLLTGAFLALWATASLLLAHFRGFRRRPPLAERLGPYVVSDADEWVDDVEVWLRQQ